MAKISPERRIINMSGFIKRQSQEILHKLNQLEVLPSDEVLELSEQLCDHAEKVRISIANYFGEEKEI